MRILQSFLNGPLVKALGRFLSQAATVVRPDGRIHPAKASAAALAVIVSGWVAHEGFSPVPYVPVQGDVPTIGHGATYYEDGTRVSMDDPPITRERALELATWHLSDVYMRCVVDSLGETPVHQRELEIAVDFAGQYGCGAWRSGGVLRAMLREDYPAACRAYLSYKFMTSNRREGAGWEQYRTAVGQTRWRFDCSTPGNRICRGVWTRSEGRYNDCMAVQGST